MSLWDQLGFSAAFGLASGVLWWLAAKAFDIAVALFPYRRPS